MVLELVAARIVAPYVGVSLYTWTAVIGIVLAGISLGNYLGGSLADRWPSTRLLGTMICLGGLAALCILGVGALDRFSSIREITAENLPLIAAFSAFAIVLLFLPCVVLGTIAPIVAKLAVRDLSSTGSTVGRIYAAGSVGSIVGTFATGYVLISWLGTRAVVWGVGVILLLLGLLFLIEHRWWWMAVAVPVVAAGSALVARQGWLHGPCTRETNYYCIQVRQEAHGGKRVQALYLDRLLHSYTSLDDPTALVYDYERTYAEAAAYQAVRHPGLRVLFIGGGGYTFPRYMEAVYPDSELDVIEIDPEVTEIAHDMLGLRRDTHVTSYNEDARTFLEREPAVTYDLVYGDAFNDYSVPYHLTTREFNDRVRAWLSDDGLYVVNIIDGPWGNFLRGYAHTLQQTFDHVYLVIDLEAWRRSPRSTLVLIATNTPLDLDALRAAEGGDGTAQMARLLIAGEELDALLSEGRTTTLTDRYAPVDQMLLPVFLNRVPD
jgi:spermidine synthase